MNIYSKYPTEILDPNIVDHYEKNPYKSQKFKIEGTVTFGTTIRLGIPAYYPFKADVFKLIDWKLDGVSQNTELSILRSVEYGTDEIEEITGGSIINAEVYMNSENSRAVLISGEIVGKKSFAPAEDNSKSNEKIELSNSVIFNKSKLGEFITQTSWNDNDIILKIDVSSLEEITDEKETCSALLKDQKLWSDKIENFFVTKMLEDLNENWLEESEEAWNETKFRKHLELETIKVSASGNFSFWYGTGDMFGGHWIVVNSSLEKGPLNIDTPG